MQRYAERTGLISGRRSKRYLWTDAFAVCNFLELGQEDLALMLVEKVHVELGRYGEGDRRSGWISGLSADEARAHPTRGGLRIGKPLPERDVDDPYDPDVEWDRDGQYFHYLTQWIHALGQVARATGKREFSSWARELAHAAHQMFACGPASQRRMFWKMSIDGSRALVSSMGQHDPVEGFVTCLELDTLSRSFETPLQPSLLHAEQDYLRMLRDTQLVTLDPLGLGGLLVDASRLIQLGAGHEGLGVELLNAAAIGLEHLVERSLLDGLPERRLAFREFGLAIGLAAVSILSGEESCDADPYVQSALHRVMRLAPMRSKVELFWSREKSRATALWHEHVDINEVMLATSLAPDGYIRIAPVLSVSHDVESKERTV
jgi:hypothetical protein